MLRTLLIASVMLAAGPALAKEVTVRGCTSSGFAGCSLLKVGKENLMLTAKAGVVIPPSNTFVYATGTISPAGPNVCNTTKRIIASKIVATKRKCK